MIPVQPLFTVHYQGDDARVRGFLVVHSISRGTAIGGVRAGKDVTVEEVMQLARLMTYKYTFWERSSGGAKAGVVLPDRLSEEQRRRVFTAFGSHLAPIIRANLYHPWSDLNCGPGDLQAIYAGAGLALVDIPDSSYYTAVTVFASLKATADFLSIPAQDCRVGIEGLGRVGAHLAREVQGWGARIVAASTALGAVVNEEGLDVDELLAARQRFGDAFAQEPGEWELIPVDQLFGVPLDILVPSARVGSITTEVASVLDVKAVVPAANAPCTVEGESVMAQKGARVLPDFICNSGGVTGTRLAQLGISPARVYELALGEFGPMVTRMLRQSEDLGLSPADLARRVTERRYRPEPSHFVRSGRLMGPLLRRLAGRAPRSYSRQKACREFVRIARSRFRDEGPGAAA
jgi:glutamate dehydrogenase (NAD(P)+)